MRFFSLLPATLLAALVAPVAVADMRTGDTSAVSAETPGESRSNTPRFGARAGVSTFGPGADLSVRFSDRFGVRGVFGGASMDFEEESDGETYEGELDLGGTAVTLDWYPTGGAFHLSGGAAAVGYEASLSATADVSGTPADIDVAIKSRSDIAPMAGVGWDTNIAGTPLNLAVGGGAIFGDGFDIDASTSTPGITQAEIDDEIADIRDLAEDLDILPFAKVMIGLRF